MQLGWPVLSKSPVFSVADLSRQNALALGGRSKDLPGTCISPLGRDTSQRCHFVALFWHEL
jgi:hypothetical protein